MGSGEWKNARAPVKDYQRNRKWPRLLQACKHLANARDTFLFN